MVGFFIDKVLFSRLLSLRLLTFLVRIFLYLLVLKVKFALLVLILLDGNHVSGVFKLSTLRFGPWLQRCLFFDNLLDLGQCRGLQLLFCSLLLDSFLPFIRHLLFDLFLSLLIFFPFHLLFFLFHHPLHF
jgi:hypothetical protein